MAYQDHLTRQIEQFGMVLRRLLNGLTGSRDPGEAELSQADAESTLEEALGLTNGALETTSPDALVALLRQHPGATETNLDLCADLLIALAETRGHSHLPYTHLLQQALAILDHINATTTTFDLERHGKVARLRSRR